MVLNIKRIRTIFINNIHWLLVCLSQLALILLCFSNLTDHDIVKLYYNIDYLYLPALYTDLFIDGNPFKGWSLTPNPYFFPDMPLYFILFFFLKSPGLTIIFYSFIQLLLIEFFFYKIIRELIDDKKRAQQYLLLSCFFIQLFLIAGAIFKENFTAHLILICSAHVGAVLASLISFWLFSRFWRTKRLGYLTVLVIIMVMSIISDRLFLVQTVIPMFAFVIFYLIKEKKTRPLIMIVLATVIGWYGFRLIGQFVIFIPDASKPPLSSQQSIFNFIEAFKFWGQNFPYTFTFKILILHLLILVLSPLALFKLKKEKRTLYCTLIFSAGLSFVFPILYGFFQSMDTLRYIIHSYFFILLLAPIFVGALFNFRSVKKGLIGLYIIYSGIVLFFSITEIKSSKIQHFLSYQSEHIQLVNENTGKLKNGIGDYWHSKDVYLLGGRKHQVVSVLPDFAPFVWQANIKWYGDRKKTDDPVFNFALDIRPDSILGPPIDSIIGANHKIFIYPDFSYRKVDKWNYRIFKLGE